MSSSRSGAFGAVGSSREQLLREQEAALEGLSAALESDGPALNVASLALALRVVGDGLRLGVGLPPSLRRWLRRLDHGELAEAVATSNEAVAPVEGLRDAEPGHLARQHLLQWLDEAESMEIAVRRALIPSEPAPALASALDEMARAKREARTWVVEHIHMNEAKAALGPRIELGSRWLEELTSEASGEDAPEEALSPLGEGLQLVEPSDNVVHAYLSRGTFARYVDAAARSNPAFESKLVAIIQAQREAGEPVSIPAHMRAREHVPVSFQLRRAAATSAASSAPPSRDLGHLGVVDAEARLTEEGADLVLFVYPERPGEVRRVTLGNETTEEERDGKLQVRVPRRAGTLHLTVEGRSGDRVEVDLEVES